MADEKGLNRKSGQASDLNDGRWREPAPPKAEQKPQPQARRDPALNPNSQRPERHISD